MRGARVRDRRAARGTRACSTGADESPLAVLADALAAGGPVLAVCADVTRRLPGSRARTGGFALTSYAALEADPDCAPQFAHLVALDPPSGQARRALLSAGSGYTHLSWGEPELRFAEQMHELEYGLRTSLVALYRSLSCDAGWPVRSSSHCFAGTVRIRDRRAWPAG